MLQDEVEQFKSKSFSTQEEIIAKTKNWILCIQSYVELDKARTQMKCMKYEKNNQMNASRAKKAT